MSNWYREAGGVYQNKNSKGFARNILIYNNDTTNIRKKFNNTDVYLTPYSYYKRNEDVLLYSGFYIDLDGEYDKVKVDTLMLLTLLTETYKIPIDQIDLFFSGNKGFHVYINPMILNIVPKTTLNEDFKIFATTLNSFTMNKTIDTVVYDRVRLLRLENSINSKSCLYKIRVTIDMIRDYTHTEMLQYASTPKELTKQIIPVANSVATTLYNKVIDEQKQLAINSSIGQHRKNYDPSSLNKLEGLLPCLAYIWEDPPTEGNRNNALVLLASGLFQCGGEFNDVLNTLKQWISDNEIGLSDNEVVTTVVSAYTQYLQGRTYGCRSAKRIGYCVERLCKFCKE